MCETSRRLKVENVFGGVNFAEELERALIFFKSITHFSFFFFSKMIDLT